MDSLWFFILVVALTGELSHQYGVTKPVDIKPRLTNNPEKLAPAGAFPYQALIYSARGQYCGGAILNENWIITAYHCVQKVTSPSEIHVLVGELDTQSHENQEQAVFGHRIIRPPGNSPPDIALIKVSKIIEFDWKNTAPIEIGRPDDGFTYHDINLKGNLSGWGDNVNGGISDKLQYAEMTRMDDVQCNSAYQNVVGSSRRPNQTFCASNSVTEICSADGGGPYVVMKKDDNKPYLIGIVADKQQCELGAPALLTDVIQSYDWIWMTINNGQSIVKIASSTILVSLITIIFTR